MKRESRRKKWLGRILLLIALIVALPALPYLGGKAVNRILLALDGRVVSPEVALTNSVVFGKPDVPTEFNWHRALRHNNYSVAQRQVLQFPSGLLYALRWEDGSRQSCLATLFVQKMWDVFGGWKGKGAHGRCSARTNTVWVNGWGEYQGFTVAYGLVDDAALVEVKWQDGSVTRAQVINGTFMSVHGRGSAVVKAVDFLDGLGEVVYSTTVHVG